MTTDRHVTSFYLHSACAFIVLALLAGASGCNISKHGEKGKEEVDIETPVGSIHVNHPMSASDTGLPAYPGARPSQDSHDAKSANIDIDTSKFGVKVVAVKFETDDSPEKVLDFYRQKMKSLGKVSECHGSFDLQVKNKGEAQQVQCEEKMGGDTELLVGDTNQHRVVKVKPRGNGTHFDLVYIQARGEREML